jgi:hypothetical protein
MSLYNEKCFLLLKIKSLNGSQLANNTFWCGKRIMSSFPQETTTADFGATGASFTMLTWEKSGVFAKFYTYNYHTKRTFLTDNLI